jgi:hypothetical protein
LTNGFSETIENLAHGCEPALHELQLEARPTTNPAVAGGFASYPWSPTQIAALLD